MSDAELTVDDRPLSPIQIFWVKVIIVTASVLVILYFAGWIIQSSIQRQADSLQILKDGPALWVNAEKKLYALADEPDIAPDNDASKLPISLGWAT